MQGIRQLFFDKNGDVVVSTNTNIARVGDNLLDNKNIKDYIVNESNRKKHDAIIAMYHDQGLVAAKTLCFDKLVNVTIGLPFVRTSPDHGTAFDIAGKNKAASWQRYENSKVLDDRDLGT